MVPVGDGSYKLVNRNSGLVADVYNNSLTHGTVVQQWYDNQTPNDPCTYGAGYLNTSGIMSASHIIWGTSTSAVDLTSTAIYGE